MRAPSLMMSGVMLAIFVAATGIALTYPPGARFQPLIVGIPAIVLCILQLVLDARVPRGPDAPQGEPPPAPGRELIAWGAFLGLIAGVLLFGFWVAIPLFLVGYLKTQAGTGWATALCLGLGATAALYALFGMLLRVPMHQGFISQWLAGAG